MNANFDIREVENPVKELEIIDAEQPDSQDDLWRGFVIKMPEEDGPDTKDKSVTVVYAGEVE